MCLRSCSLSYQACYAQAPYFLHTLAASHFSTFHKPHNLPKRVTEHKMCVLIFLRPLLKTFLILRRIQQNIVINVKTSSCEVPAIYVGF